MCAVWKGSINAIVCVDNVVLMVEFVVICCCCDCVVHGEIYGGFGWLWPRAWWLLCCCFGCHVYDEDVVLMLLMLWCCCVMFWPWEWPNEVF